MANLPTPRQQMANLPTPRQQMAKLRASWVAGEQWGVISWRQLADCGVSKSRARRWRLDGSLHVLFGTVFTFGHTSVPVEGLLTAALLYAGEGAVLSHATAAWWGGLIDGPPRLIDVSVARHVRPVPGVIVHQRRHLHATRHCRFPVTPVAQTLLDYAANADLVAVRRALAQADYLRLLEPVAVAAVLGQGRPGAARLREALERHQPTLARTRSWLEAAFIPLCESAGIALPEINARVAGWTVDAVWREERVVVELDGYDNHSSRAQIKRDRRKELELRAVGFLVIRYTWEQIVHQPEVVAADLLAALTNRAEPPASRTAA
jgi:hypothetical protein